LYSDTWDAGTFKVVMISRAASSDTAAPREWPVTKMGALGFAASRSCTAPRIV
jgi:hypothetical protein